jgi:hypothetical protein
MGNPMPELTLTPRLSDFNCHKITKFRLRKEVLWNRNYFLRFRFRFRLLKSYGSGSVSDFRKSYGSGSGSYFRKVPVPVPDPNLDHNTQIFPKNFWIFLPFYIVSCLSRKKFKNFNKFIVKCE